MRRLLFLFPVVIVAILVAVFWAGLDRNRDKGALPSALIGKPAPITALPGLMAGAPALDLAAYKGKLIAVNFFASWCVPCRAEHQYLRQLTERYRIPVVGIAWRDKPVDARAFIAELGNPYDAIADDERGRTGIDFGIAGVPETFLIDGEGIVRYRIAGPITEPVLTGQVGPAIEALQP
jgi:cytochrome c biogenesis protein CcmG, thiol:disulfide interchange protein DsbE